MMRIGIGIDGVMRDLFGQFDKVYRRVFIYNEELVNATIPDHSDMAQNGVGEEDFVVKEESEEQVRAREELIKKREQELISLPVNSEDLLNHYKFEESKSSFMEFGDNAEVTSTFQVEYTQKQMLEKFMYDDYALQIFARAEPYPGAIDIVNRIQAAGLMSKNYEVVLLSTAKSRAIPATYSFLGMQNSRARNIVFVEKEYQKWDHCDILIDADVKSLQSVPEDKYAIRVLRDWNQYDNIEYTYSSIQELFKSGLIEKLTKPIKA
jgi:hypothetical protein